MGGKREHTCSAEGTVFSNVFRNFFLQGALRDFGLSRGSPQILVKAFLKKPKQNGGKNHTVIKSICFAHSSFQKERVKQCPLIKKRENLSHTHQSMNTYHVNKWLIFQRWHCGAMRMQSCYFLFYWFGGSFVGIFGGQSGTQESLGSSYLKFILQLKVPISKWIFSCLDAHVNIRQDYSE